VTSDDFLNLHNTSFEEFMDRISCSEFVVVPFTKSPRIQAFQAFHTMFNTYTGAHMRGLFQDALEMPDVARYLDEVIKQGGPDITEVFMREYKEMFKEGVRDRINLRYLVSSDGDYGNWNPQGLFISLEGANKCGERLLKGTTRENIKVDVMIQRP